MLLQNVEQMFIMCIPSPDCCYIYIFLQSNLMVFGSQGNLWQYLSLFLIKQVIDTLERLIVIIGSIVFSDNIFIVLVNKINIHPMTYLNTK